MSPMTDEFFIRILLRSREMTLRDVVCRGTCRHRSAEECASTTHLVFPYRGTYVRHVGQDNAVADANQLMLFNHGESYRISHPISGGDASLSLALEEGLLQELVPKGYLRSGGELAFRVQRLRIDPRVQALVSLLRHGLTRAIAEPLQAETLVLTLVRRALGERTSRPPARPTAAKDWSTAPSWPSPRIPPGGGRWLKLPPRWACRRSTSLSPFSRSKGCRSTAINCAAGLRTPWTCCTSTTI